MRCNILRLIMFLSCVIPASCATVNVRASNGSADHKYAEVNGFVATYVEQWIDLAKDRGLSFRHIVNIGFTNIKGTSVGQTRFAKEFREIDIDSTFWNKSTEMEKNMLVWHELAHAYCYRWHDFGKGKDRLYGDNVPLAIKKMEDGGFGFYPDHCPRSLMFPALPEDHCFKKYYFEYINEMFQNCIPY